MEQFKDVNRRKSKHKEKLNIAMFGQKRIPSREGGVEIVVEELCSRRVAQLKQQLLKDQEFMQQIKERAGVEEREENIPEENDNGLDMDEDMMLAGLTMFETDF